MAAFLKHKFLHGVFEISLLLKAFNGVWETLSGIIVLFVSKVTIEGWLSTLAFSELLEDPSDRVIGFIEHTLLNPMTSTKTFVAFYILIHGLLNIFLAIQLHRKKSWAYIVTIIVTLLLIAYQVHRITLFHSLILTVFTLIDAAFVWLTWHEYKSHHLKTKLAATEKEAE
ncbi:MAG: DUF2127 domain-containing protein [bacterium]|nr:DUF2127 domain-containing protein [bacterium]